jgi:hypothetical protein
VVDEGLRRTGARLAKAEKTARRTLDTGHGFQRRDHRAHREIHSDGIEQRRPVSIWSIPIRRHSGTDFTCRRHGTWDSS